jgi:hypothetical protein
MGSYGIIIFNFIMIGVFFVNKTGKFIVGSIFVTAVTISVAILFKKCVSKNNDECTVIGDGKNFVEGKDCEKI